MANKPEIYPAQENVVERVAERTREITKRSRQILKDNPKPDTFVGGKTQEPFPMENDEIEGWLNSKELQPPE